MEISLKILLIEYKKLQISVSIFRNNLYSNKVVVITGGGTGINF